MSLERIWRCDVYRAGDGVHRAWLERRAEMGGPFRRLSRVLNRKHSATLALEESLFAEGGAGRVIANSTNGEGRDRAISTDFQTRRSMWFTTACRSTAFQRGEESRAKNSREMLGLKSEDIAVLFAGSGWERKGLRFAIEAIEASGTEMRFWSQDAATSEKFGSARVRVSRRGSGYAGALWSRGYFLASHNLRSFFQRLPRSLGRRASGRDHAREWFVGDHQEWCSRHGPGRSTEHRGDLRGASFWSDDARREQPESRIWRWRVNSIFPPMSPDVGDSDVLSRNA